MARKKCLVRGGRQQVVGNSCDLLGNTPLVSERGQFAVQCPPYCTAINKARASWHTTTGCFT
jgi:hypothetical protein